MAEEANLQKPDDKTAAAYLPFKTFLGSFDVFDHGVPHKIDRSIWRNQSGVVQGQIVMALRFFRLIDENDAPTPALQRFVSNKEKRKEHIGALLQHAYKSILDRDLTKMTPKMLNDELDQYRVSGDTKRKAAAFFLQAAHFAELPMHPLLQTKTRAASSTQPRKKRKTSNTANKHETSDPIQTVNSGQDGESKSVRLKSGAVVTLKVSANWLELPPDERKFVFELIDLLQSPSVSTSKSDEEEE